MKTKTSGREAELINALDSRGVIIFSPREVHRFLDTSYRNSYQILNRMHKKGLVRRIEKGKYILSERWEELDVYEIASNILNASYLGFISALHFHHMTEQVPQKVFLASTKRKKPLTIQQREVRFVNVQKDEFFGYEQYGEIVASNPEKTVVDCLKQLEYSGGLGNLYSSIDESLDIELMVNYCERLGISSVTSRLGYLLDKKGLLTDRDAQRLKNLIRHYSRLSPDRERKNPDKHWKLYVNREL
ncbi:MAG: type IV toxin-antitoxin system AbiEi family antitoxin [Candidatus Nanohaloarchaea archaeon]|nr:type IV toxin-antitoxin system AbiEi family antitoxin [Candidatus Nanohaloarchaea archaeon]